jgi:acyl carrier protein
MKKTTPEEVRSFLLRHFSAQLGSRNLAPEAIADDFDLLTEGVIDSFGVLEMVAALETELGGELDLEELDADKLTRIGPLSRFVAEQATGNSAKSAG